MASALTAPIFNHGSGPDDPSADDLDVAFGKVEAAFAEVVATLATKADERALAVGQLTDVADAIKAILRASDVPGFRTAIGLGNVANIAPADLPVSKAAQAEIDQLDVLANATRSLVDVILGGLNASGDTLASVLAKIVTAANDVAGRVSKNGDIMLGILTLMFANPYLVLKNSDGGANNNADWRALHYGPDGRLYLQNTDKNGVGVNAFSFGRGGDLYSSATGDLKMYVDKGVRTDVAQNFSRAAMAQARRNAGAGPLWGRNIYDGVGFNFTAADANKTHWLNGVGNDTLPAPNTLAPDDGFEFINYGDNFHTFTCPTGPNNGNIFWFAGYYGAGSIVCGPGQYLKVTTDGVGLYICYRGSANDRALSPDQPQTFTDTQKQRLLANADISIPHCQGRLTYDANFQIALRVAVGNKIFINGNYRTIPIGGVTLSNSGLSASTVYYVYAGWTGSAITLIANTSGPAFDPLYGYKVFGAGSSDAANRLYTYVGMIYVGSDGKFVDSPAFRGVVTAYNKRLRNLRGAVISASTSSTSQVELSASARAYVLIEAGVGVIGSAFGNGGTGASQAGYAMYSAISLDGADSSPSGLASNAAYGNGSLPSGDAWEPSEGLHYLTVKGSVPSGQSGTFNGAISGLVWM